MAVVALDNRLADLIDVDAPAEPIATGYTFTEGPVWHRRERSLIFPDLQCTPRKDSYTGLWHRGTRHRACGQAVAQQCQMPKAVTPMLHVCLTLSCLVSQSTSERTVGLMRATASSGN